MKKLDLKAVENNYKFGQKPPNNSPQLSEDSMIFENDELIGFYTRQVPERLRQFVDIADKELRSERVPKSVMKRASGLRGDGDVLQYSCIIGSIPPKPIMRRNYASRSSVHSVESAQIFIKAMTLAGLESAKIIKEIAPSLYENHKKAVYENVSEEWRFADIFTSSISNCNIAASIHQDNLNVKPAVNVIITKRLNAKGGNLYLPDYDLTVDSIDNSMLVYPAWRNKHGVTEIVPTHHNGYRNSLVWYALNAFKGV
tara:strand:- start:221 stop:988 length:768 start_codon:yes stop_codon:yes gene_type:complete